jgi:hypothetical protein
MPTWATTSKYTPMMPCNLFCTLKAQSWDKSIKLIFPDYYYTLLWQAYPTCNGNEVAIVLVTSSVAFIFKILLIFISHWETEHTQAAYTRNNISWFAEQMDFTIRFLSRQSNRMKYVYGSQNVTFYLLLGSGLLKFDQYLVMYTISGSPWQPT